MEAERECARYCGRLAAGIVSSSVNVQVVVRVRERSVSVRVLSLCVQFSVYAKCAESYLSCMACVCIIEQEARMFRYHSTLQCINKESQITSFYRITTIINFFI